MIKLHCYSERHMHNKGNTVHTSCIYRSLMCIVAKNKKVTSVKFNSLFQLQGTVYLQGKNIVSTFQKISINLFKYELNLQDNTLYLVHDVNE